MHGGHTEGAGYTDTQGSLDDLFVLAQDDANIDPARPGVNMASLLRGSGGDPGVAIDDASLSATQRLETSLPTAMTR